MCLLHRVLDLDFRKGYAGCEADLKREAEKVETLDFGIQEETDWNVDAVIDEDALFKLMIMTR